MAAPYRNARHSPQTSNKKNVIRQTTLRIQPAASPSVPSPSKAVSRRDMSLIYNIAPVDTLDKKLSRGSHSMNLNITVAFHFDTLLFHFFFGIIFCRTYEKNVLRYECILST